MILGKLSCTPNGTYLQVIFSFLGFNPSFALSLWVYEEWVSGGLCHNDAILN